MNKSKENQTFTKVVWKLCIKPINCPASKQLNESYEVTWEFKCPNEELEKFKKDMDNIEATHSDKEENLTNLAYDSHFMIKSKTLKCNYEELKGMLGYEPDALEFDAYVKKLLKQCQLQMLECQHQSLKDLEFPIAS